MSDRPTKEFVTPEGNTVVFYKYLTGGEAEQIEDEMVSQIKMTPSGEVGVKPEMSEMSVAFMAEQTRKTLRFLLVSVNGNTTDPYDAFMQLPSYEVKAVKTEINKTTNPSTPPESGTPGNDTSTAGQ